MRGYSDIGNLTNINAVQPVTGGFKGVLSIAGSGYRETAVFPDAAAAETALAAIRPAGITKESFNY